MKKWFLLAYILPIALSPSVGRAADLDLRIIGMNLSVTGVTPDPSLNYLLFPYAVGDVGRSFGGSAQSVADAVGIGLPLPGIPTGTSMSTANSASWDIRFRVEQPRLTFLVHFRFTDGAAVASVLFADASANADVSMSLNGVTRLSDHQAHSCDTIIGSCANSTPVDYGDFQDLVLENLVVGSIIDIAGSLSVNSSASATGCADLILETVCSFGFAHGGAGTVFSVSAIPEPPTLALFGTGLLLVALGAAWRSSAITP